MIRIVILLRLGGITFTRDDIYGQSKVTCSPPALFTFYPDFAALCLYQLFADTKPEPDPFYFLNLTLPRAEKPVEHSRQFFWRNPYALVSDTDHQFVYITPSNSFNFCIRF